MESFSRAMQVRWSDLDPNFHLRHSVYYDWGAYCRVEFLASVGLGWRELAAIQTGPVIFREEAIFRKEIRQGDNVNITMSVVKAKRDYSRFTIRHEVFKDNDVLSATITVDIAWLNGVTRKLTALPQEYINLLTNSPLAADFEWMD